MLGATRRLQSLALLELRISKNQLRACRRSGARQRIRNRDGCGQEARMDHCPLGTAIQACIHHAGPISPMRLVFRVSGGFGAGRAGIESLTGIATQAPRGSAWLVAALACAPAGQSISGLSMSWLDYDLGRIVILYLFGKGGNYGRNWHAIVHEVVRELQTNNISR